MYFRTEFCPPWSVKVPELESAARFHLVVQGRCFVMLPSSACVDLGPGDLILIPAGRSHIIADQPTIKAPELGNITAGSEPTMAMAC